MCIPVKLNFGLIFPTNIKLSTIGVRIIKIDQKKTLRYKIGSLSEKNSDSCWKIYTPRCLRGSHNVIRQIRDNFDKYYYWLCNRCKRGLTNVFFLQKGLLYASFVVISVLANQGSPTLEVKEERRLVNEMSFRLRNKTQCFSTDGPDGWTK